jgi:hypothetical protein
MRPDNPDIVYVTDAWSGVNISVDGGRTWLPSNNGIITRAGHSGDAIPVFCLTIDPHNPEVLWIGTQNRRGIFKSTDGGKTWVEKDRGISEREGISFRGLTVDPRDSKVIYAAAEISSFAWAGREISGREFDLTKGVVYKTTDGGEHWTGIWRGDNLARYIWINPRDPDVIYVSTGIFDREAANSDPERNLPGGVGVVKRWRTDVAGPGSGKRLDQSVHRHAVHASEKPRRSAGRSREQRVSRRSRRVSLDQWRQNVEEHPSSRAYPFR